MRKIAIIAACLLAGLGAGAQDTLRLSLDSCVRYAYQHNTSALSAEVQVASAETALSGARMRLLPNVGAQASQSLARSEQTTRSGQYGISASLPLFQGLGTLNNIRYQRSQLEHSQLRVQQVHNKVAMQIVSAYLTILMNEERAAYQREVVATAGQQAAEGELKYQVGRILESDYLLLNASYLAAQSDLESTLLTLENNYNDLSIAMGYEGGATVAAMHSTRPSPQRQPNSPPSPRRKRATRPWQP